MEDSKQKVILVAGDIHGSAQRALSDIMVIIDGVVDNQVIDTKYMERIEAEPMQITRDYDYSTYNHLTPLVGQSKHQCTRKRKPRVKNKKTHRKKKKK